MADTVQFLNKWTGEIYELPADTPEQIRDAWVAIKETMQSCQRAQAKLKVKVEELMTDQVYPVGDYQFRRMIIQRQNYDKAVMREVLDADTYDLFMVPDKVRIDNWLKENMEQLGGVSTALRKSMVPVGDAFPTLRLERIGGVKSGQADHNKTG